MLDMEEKMVLATGGAVATSFVVVAVALQAAFWGAIIYGAFWCAEHFGLIQAIQG